jgi:hypothetical protein
MYVDRFGGSLYLDSLKASVRIDQLDWIVVG